MSVLTALCCKKAAASEWYKYWTNIMAAEDCEARYWAMTVNFKCSDGVIREFLLDTGAAASLIPQSIFKKVCTKIGLRPSRLRLRAANGQLMVAAGTSILHLRLPEQSMASPPLISHEFEVLPDGGMSSGLLITGVDLWDKLRPQIDMAAGIAHCNPSEEISFDVPFSIKRGEEKVRTINSIDAATDEQHSGQRSACLTEDLHLYPRQEVRTTMRVRWDAHDSNDPVVALRPIRVHFGQLEATQIVSEEGVRSAKIRRPWSGSNWLEIECLVRNPCKHEVLSIPAGCVLSRSRAAVYQSITQLLEEDPLWAAEASNAAARSVRKTEAMEHTTNDQDEWAAAIEVDIQERAAAGCRWKRPARMVFAAALLIIWSLWEIAWQSSSWVANVSVTEAKNQQKIYCLPDNHPMRADEASLRQSTVDFCSSEKGRGVYDKWIKRIGSKFEYGSISESEKENYMLFLFNFSELFDRVF